MNLADVKEVKNAFGCTVNDVVLTMCSGALRKYLADRDELPDSSLVAMVPVSVHGKSDAPGHEQGLRACSPRSPATSPTRSSGSPRSPSRTSSPRNTTRRSARRCCRTGRSSPRRTRSALAVRVYSKLRLAERHPVIHNLVISNVPGPPMPIYFLGARITGFYPFGPVFDGAGLNVTVMSNDGHLDVGADRLPRARPAPVGPRRRPADRARRTAQCGARRASVTEAQAASSAGLNSRGVEHARRVPGVGLVDGRVRDRPGERPLPLGRDQPVARRHHHRGRDVHGRRSTGASRSGRSPRRPR